MAFTPYGHMVHVADGVKAFDAMNSRSYDLVITDSRTSVVVGSQVIALAMEKSPEATPIVITRYPLKCSPRLRREMSIALYLV